MPSSNGGLPITNYVVQRSYNGGRTWVSLSDGVSTNRFYTVTGLTNGATYQFRVAARNAVGWSRVSNVVTATPDGVSVGHASLLVIPATTSDHDDRTTSADSTTTTSSQHSTTRPRRAPRHDHGTAAGAPSSTDGTDDLGRRGRHRRSATSSGSTPTATGCRTRTRRASRESSRAPRRRQVSSSTRDVTDRLRHVRVQRRCRTGPTCSSSSSRTATTSRCPTRASTTSSTPTSSPSTNSGALHARTSSASPPNSRTASTSA